MQISQEHFGVIYSGYPKDEDFYRVVHALGGTVSRYPGGTMTERDLEVYDVGRDEPFDPTYLFADDRERDRTTFSEYLQLAATQLTPHIIMPTARYVDDVTEAYQDAETLVQSVIASGVTKVRIEIGNEYYALDELSAASYGEIASLLVQRFSDLETEYSQLDIEIVVQLGKTDGDNLDILASFGSIVGSLVDGLVFHAMPINLNNLYLNSAVVGSNYAHRFELVDSMFGDWLEAFGGRQELHMSAWAVGAPISDLTETDLSFQDYGARGAVTALATFAGAIAIGVESSSVWGAGVSNLNTLGEVVDGEVQLSHVGLIYSELQNSVVGYSYIGNSSILIDFEDSLEPIILPFMAPGQAVLYLVAPPGTFNLHVSAVLAQWLPQAGSADISIDSVRRITTSWEDGYIPTHGSEDRLHELASLVASDEFQFDEGRFEIILPREYDIVEISLSWLLEGHEGDEVFDGTIGVNRTAGLGGDDEIFGRGGNDILLGGPGNDLLTGDDGDDLLIGDELGPIDGDFAMFFS